LAAAPTAQEGDGLPTEYTLLVPPGGYVDLDAGLLLSRPDQRSWRPDLRFGRDGAGRRGWPESEIDYVWWPK
jgi:hypothetical protein